MLGKVLLQWRGEAPAMLRHEGLSGFLRDDIVPLALVSGLVCTLGIIPFTTFLSHQTTECPIWALECKVYTQKMGTIQGAVTLVYTIGLMCLSCACWALTEVSLWPLLCRQAFTYKQIDRFLAVSRGSIPAIPLALGTIKRWDTWSIIACAVLVTLTSLSAGPVVGFVFDQPLLPATYEGNISVGGGAVNIFRQENPSIIMDVAAAGFYSDWFSGFATSEPMSGLRDWIVDREILSGRGSFTASAVMIRKNVSCDAFPIVQMTGPNSGTLNQLYFQTKLANIIDQNNPEGVGDEAVAVYNSRLLSAWVHDVHFVSSNRTRATLVFALPGGILEGSSISFLNVSKKDHYSNVSSVACEVDVELTDATMTVGDGGPAQSSLPVLSNMQTLISGNVIPKNATNVSAMYTHREVALLFAIAPVLVGNGYKGNQPTFIPYDTNISDAMLISSGNSGGRGRVPVDYVWHRRQIEDLIDGSIGALSLSYSLKSRDTTLRMKSSIPVHRMSPSRNAILAIPIAILLSIWFILVFLTRLLHRRESLRIIERFETAQLLEKWQSGLAPINDGTNREVVIMKYQPEEHISLRNKFSISKPKQRDLDIESSLDRDDHKGEDGADGIVEQVSTQEKSAS